MKIHNYRREPQHDAWRCIDCGKSVTALELAEIRKGGFGFVSDQDALAQGKPYMFVRDAKVLCCEA